MLMAYSSTPGMPKYAGSPPEGHDHVGRRGPLSSRPPSPTAVTNCSSKSMSSTVARRKLAPASIRDRRKGWATFWVWMSLLMTPANMGQNVKVVLLGDNHYRNVVALILTMFAEGDLGRVVAAEASTQHEHFVLELPERLALPRLVTRGFGLHPDRRAASPPAPAVPPPIARLPFITVFISAPSLLDEALSGTVSI